MLSVCIPVFNNNIVSLVSTLHQQCLESKIAFEIICIDDASLDSIKKANRSITSYPEVHYSELNENVGRAVIRNLLAENANYENILYLDSDISISEASFIKKYLTAINSSNPVVIGGIYYDKKNISKNTKLHFTYGQKRESKSAEMRNKNPYSSFLTGNLLVQKKIVLEIQFLSSLKEYGHEDTLFCMELKKRSIPVLHINNPVSHEGLETNAVFIEKQLTAVRNLSGLIVQGYNMNGISLYDYYLMFKKYHLSGIFTFSFSIVQPITKKILRSGWTNWLFLFDSLRLYELTIELNKNTRSSI
jgi:glycosyltransferase involved in cell wall biosynthesis